jgi:hypothetical protein
MRIDTIKEEIHITISLEKSIGQTHNAFMVDKLYS